MITKEGPPIHFAEGIEVKDFDLGAVIDQLEVTGAVSVPYLTEASRKILLEEAQEVSRSAVFFGTYRFQGRDQLNEFDVPSDSKLSTFLKGLNQDLIKKAKAITPYPFKAPLDLNISSLLEYAEGSLGRPIHTDQGINLRIVVPLDEGPKLFVCDNEQGDNSLEIDRAPGNLIIIRAPGVRGITEKQYHYVTDAQSGGYTLSAAQKVS